MKNTQKKEAAPAQSGSRYSELKTMLDDRRRELQAEVQGKMRGVREEGAWGGKLNEVLDAVESAEADIQEDLEFALVQMKSETLNKVNDALVRLEQGSYGNCFDCGEEIAEKRLRGMRSTVHGRTGRDSLGEIPFAMPWNFNFSRPVPSPSPRRRSRLASS